MKPTQSIPPEDAHFKKELTFNYYGQSLKFRVAQALFSSHQIDVGTARLLRTIEQHLDTTGVHKILDLGCGYGPLGLTLKARDLEREVQFSDRDALALSYTQQNAALNNLSDVSVYGSLGYDDVQDGDFDLIISNIPGKAGEAAITHMVLDAAYHLRPGGQVALVIVSPLAEWVTALLQQPNIEIRFQETRSGHAIYHYTFAESPGADFVNISTLEQGAYDRVQLTVNLNIAPMTMKTAYGLPEFDSLSYRTQLLLKTLFKLELNNIKRVLTLNPGQGYVPLTLWDTFEPESIHLVSRDLLELRYSERNLIANGCSQANIHSTHQVGIDVVTTPDADLITYPLRDDENAEFAAQTVAAAATHLTADGKLLVVGNSTAITRLLTPLAEYKQVKVRKRKKNKGQSLLIVDYVGSA